MITTTNTDTLRTYTKLIEIPTYEERFEYLKIGGRVGEETFGSMRWINQVFYTSEEWRRARDKVIIRDDGCDMGHPDHPIRGRIIVHHLNSVTREDIEHRSSWILDPEFLICVSESTHRAIHYGDASLLPRGFVERRPYDTCPWK